MKKLVQLLFVAMLLIATLATTSFAGAWTAKQNAFYEKLAFNYYYAHEFFSSSGSRGSAQ